MLPFTLKFHLHKYGLLVSTSYSYPPNTTFVNVKCACGKTKKVIF